MGMSVCHPLSNSFIVVPTIIFLHRLVAQAYPTSVNNFSLVASRDRDSVGRSFLTQTLNFKASIPGFFSIPLSRFPILFDRSIVCFVLPFTYSVSSFHTVLNGSSS
jgi:hypothetical protein